MTHTLLKPTPLFTSAFRPDVSFRGRLPYIAFLSLVFFLNFSARFIWGPLLGEIESELQLTHATSGSLFIYITVGYFWGLLLSGHVSKRLCHGRTISLSCIASGLVLFGLCASLQLLWFRVLLFVLGAFSGLHLPSAAAAVIDRLASKDFSKAFAVHELGPNLGFVLCPLIAQLMLLAGSWRYALIFLGTSLIAAGICYRFGRRVCDCYGESPSLKNIGFLFAVPLFWVMLILFSLALSAAVGIYTMLPLYLQIERGMATTDANLILSISRFTGILAPFSASWLCSRYDDRVVSAVLIVGAGLATMLLPVSPNCLIWLPMVVQPFMVGAFFVPGYAMLAAVIPPEFRNLVVALITAIAMVLGGGVTPAIIGIFADAHMFNAAFLLFGAMVTASALSLFQVKEASCG